MRETFGPYYNNRGEQRFGKKYARSHRYRIAGLKLLPNLSCRPTCSDKSIG